MPRHAVLSCYFLAAVSLSQTSTFKTDVNLRLLSVRVTDGRGNAVLGLPASSFSLLEDDVAQRIAFFEAEKQPISLGILLDTSSSMRVGGKIEHAKTALHELIAAGHPDNELFLLEFGNKLGDIVQLDGDHRQLSTSISSATVGRSGTALYDALAVGALPVPECAAHAASTDCCDRRSRSTQPPRH